MRDKASERLRRIYPHLDSQAVDHLTDRVLVAVGANEHPNAEGSLLPGADEVVLITYGDTIVNAGGGVEADEGHLRSLAGFLGGPLKGIFSTVHVLPFFPSTSDGGFAIADYRRVDEKLGDWNDLAHAARPGHLMVDVVCNHGSAQSEWFEQFLADEEPGRSFYFTADAGDDLEMVVRPRTHPLLLPVETAAGPRHVWATFSHDQVDFDFTNPDVLVEFCEILGLYLTKGADRIRLDAIAYLWKQIGTPCIHLAQTHEIVKLMRLLIEARDPHALVITETNVPHTENISYFGDGDEAHVVYNFTLAPLITWSLLLGNARTITTWLQELEPAPEGCTFLNFLASHDGIGLRPVEDLITSDELTPMIDRAKALGGAYSAYNTPSGDRPYELNVSLADLLAGPDGATADRFVTAHALMMAVQGIPAVYIHSMLSSPGDLDAVATTGHKRDINRPQVALEDALAVVGSGWRGDVFRRLSDLIALRRALDVFAPESTQVVHAAGDHVVMIERGSGARAILAVHNMADVALTIGLPHEFVPAPGGSMVDLIADEAVGADVELGPWQSRWIQRRA